MYICETCREQVRPATEGDGLIYAVELQRADGMGTGPQWVEGLGAFFHQRCFPRGSQRWRMKPMPENIDDGDD